MSANTESTLLTVACLGTDALLEPQNDGRLAHRNPDDLLSVEVNGPQDASDAYDGYVADWVI